jgi:uncharacterized ParB-like nuclease family protein
MPTLAEALRGYQPPTTSALADPIKEHFRTLPQQLATNQAAMDNTMASMYKTDFMGKPNPNYRPEAMQEFTQNYMPALMGSTNAVKAVKAMSWEIPKKPKNSVLVDIPLDKIEHGESAMSGGKLTWPTAKQTIKEYAEKKTDFPPIEVMGNDPSYEYFDKPFMIYDGSHRYEAAKLRGDNSIKAYISKNDADAMNALDQLKNSRKELIQQQIDKIE